MDEVVADDSACPDASDSCWDKLISIFDGDELGAAFDDRSNKPSILSPYAVPPRRTLATVGFPPFGRPLSTLDTSVTTRSPTTVTAGAAASSTYALTSAASAVAATEATHAPNNQSSVKRYTSANVMVDASNPGSIFLPLQKITFQRCRRDGTPQTITALVGPAVLSSTSLPSAQTRTQPSILIAETPTSAALCGFPSVSMGCSSSSSSWSYQSLRGMMTSTMSAAAAVRQNYAWNRALDFNNASVAAPIENNMFPQSSEDNMVEDDDDDHFLTGLNFHETTAVDDSILSCPEPLPFHSSGLNDDLQLVQPNTTPSSSDAAVTMVSAEDMLPSPTPVSPPPLLSPTMIKPLTPYNYFYRVERDNIVNGIKKRGDPLPEAVTDYSDERMQELLHHHWHVDPLKGKRAHRKGHGKIDFPTLSKAIALRWKDLSVEGKDFYRRVAKADQEQFARYTGIPL